MDVQIVVRRQAAVVTYDSDRVTVPDMVKALDEAGFPVKGEPKMVK